MLGKLAASILVPYLSKYVENVDAQKLNIDLWSGTARLQNLVLRREVLNELLEPPTDGSPTTGGQPSPSPSAGPRFRVHRGICTEVNLHIPLKRLRSEPVVIKVSELFITLTGVEDDEDEPRCGSSTHHRTSHYWDRVAMQKEAELERLDAERRAALEGGGPTCSGCADTSTTTAASGGVGASLTGYFSRLGEVVLNNIIIEVQTAHIRWEDRSQRTQLGVIVGPIRLANVCAETGGVGFSDPAGQPRVMKRLSFDGLQLYCEEVDATHHGATSTEEEEEARWLSTMEDLDAWTEAMRSRTDQGRQHHSTIVGPVGGQLDVALVLRSCMRKLLSTPYANVNLHLNPLATRLHRSQYVSLARALSRFTTSAPVDATSPSLPRPTEPPLLNPRAWWRYAIRRVRRDLLAPHREALLQRVSEACVMDYRVLFRDVARQMPMSAEKRKTYRFITRFMSVADMWAGRRHVYAQMANERQLRRNEHQLKEAGSPTGASSGGGSMPPKKQGWLSWMMGTQKKSADVAAEVAPFVDEDDLIRQLTAEYEVEPSEDAESASSPDLSPGEGAFQLVDRHLPATYCWVDLSVRLPQVRLCLELSEEEQIFFTLDHVAARMRSYNRQRSLQFAFALENLTITNPTATNLSSSRNSSSGASAIPNLVEGAPTPEDGEDGPMHLYSANSIVVGEHGLVFPPRAASSGSLDVVSCTQVMSPPHSSRGSSSTENHSDRDEEENVPEDGTTAGPPTTAAGVRRRHPVMDSLERHLQLSMEHSDCTARTATPQSLAGDAGHRTSRPLIDLCGAIFPAKPLLEDAPVDVALEVRVLPLRIIADPHTLEHLAAFVKLPREVDVSAVATRTRGAAQRVGHAASRELRTTIATTTHWLLTVEVAAPIVVLPKSLQTSAATSPALALSLGRVDLHRRPTPPSEKKEELYNRTVAQCRGLFVEMTTVEAALTTLGSGFMMLPEVSVEAEVLQLQPCVAMEPRGEKMDDFVLRLRIPRVQLACSLHQSYILADLLDAWRVYLQPQPTSPTLAASATPGRADGMRGPSSSSCPLLAPSPPARRDGVAEVADGDGDRSSSSPPPLHLRLEAFLEQVSLHIHEDERPSLQVAPTPRFCSTLQHTHLRLRMSPTSTEASVALRSIAVVDAKDASLPILSGAVVYASLLRRICGEANPSAPFPAGDGSSTSPVATSTPATPSAAVAASGSTTTAPAAASAEAAAPPVVRIRIKPSVVLRVGTPFTEMLEHVVDLSNVVMSVMQDGGYAGANSAQSPLVATTTIRDLDDDDDGGMEEEDVGSDVELRRQLLYMQKQCRTPDLPVVHLKLSMEGTHHVELYNRRRAADGTIDAHDTLFAITSATDVNLRMSRRAVTMEANASIGQVSLQLAESFPLHPRFSTVLHYTPHAHSRHTTGDDTSYHRGSSVSRTSSASLSPTPSRSVLSPVVSASPLTTSAFFNRQPTSLERSCRGGLPEVLNTSITSTSTGMMPHVSLGYRRAKPVMALFVEEDGERHLANPNDLRYSCALDVELGSSRIVMDPHSILLLHAYCTSGFLVRVMEVASRPLYNGRRLPPVHRPPPLLMSLRVVAHDCRVAVPVDARDGDSAIFTASMSHVVVQNSLNIMHGGHESTNISLREMALTSQTSSASAAAELLQPHAFVELAIRRPLDPLSDDVRQLDVRSEELALAMSATEVAGLVELLRGVQARGAVAPSESVAAPPGPSAAVEWASPTHEQRHQDPEGLAARADTTTTHHLSYREEPNLCVAAKIARLRFLLRDVDDAMRAEPGAAVELNAAGVSAVWSGVGNQTQLRWSVLEVLDARASCGRGAEPSSGAAATNTNNNSISLSSPALLVVEEGSMKYGDTLTTRSILMSDFGIRPTALASAEPGEADMMMASMSGTEALTLADLPPPPPPTLPSVEQDGNGDAPQSMELLRVSVLSADLAIRRFAITHQWRMLYDLLCRSNLVSAPTPSSQPNATPSTTDGPRHLRVLLTAPSIHVPFFSTSGDRILEAHLSSVLVDVAALSPSTRIALRVQHVELFDGLSGSTIFTKRRGGLDGLSSMLPSAREDEAGSPATTEHSPTTLPGDEMMMAAGGSLTAAEVFPSVPSGGGGGGLLRHATAGASLTSSAGDDVEVIHLHLQLEEDARRQVLRATLSAWEVLMAPPQLMGLLHYFGSPSEPVMMMYQLVTELTTVPATTPSASAVSVVSVGDASTSTSLQPWAIHVRMHQPRFILTSDNLDRHHRRSNYVEARMERVRVALTLLPRKDESGRASSSSMVVGAVVRLTDLAVPEVIERTSITARLARGGDGVERADVHLDRAMVMIHYTEVERLQRVLRGSLATPASPYYHCLALAPAVEVEVAATPSIVPCRHVVLHLEALTIALHDIVDINSHTVLATDLNLQLDMPSSSSTMLRASLMSVRVLEHFTTRALLTLGPKAGSTPTAAATSAPSTAIAVEMSVEGQRTDLGIRLGVMSVAVIPKGVAGLANLILAMQHLIPDASEESTTSTINPDNTTSMLHAQCDCEEFQIRLVQRSGKDVALLRLPRIAAHATVGAVLEELGLTLPSLVMHDRFSTNTRYPDIIYAVARDGDAADATSTTQPTQPWMELHISHHNNTTTQAPTQSEGEATVEPPRPQVRLVMGSMSYVVVPAILSSIQAVVSETIILVGDRTRELRSGHYSTHHRGVGGGSTRSLAPLTPTAAATTAASSSGWPLWLDPLPSLDIRIQNQHVRLVEEATSANSVDINLGNIIIISDVRTDGNTTFDTLRLTTDQLRIFILQQSAFHREEALNVMYACPRRTTTASPTNSVSASTSIHMPTTPAELCVALPPLAVNLTKEQVALLLSLAGLLSGAVVVAAQGECGPGGAEDGSISGHHHPRRRRASYRSNASFGSRAASQGGAPAATITTNAAANPSEGNKERQPLGLPPRRPSIVSLRQPTPVTFTAASLANASTISAPPAQSTGRSVVRTAPPSIPLELHVSLARMSTNIADVFSAQVEEVELRCSSTTSQACVAASPASSSITTTASRSSLLATVRCVRVVHVEEGHTTEVLAMDALRISLQSGVPPLSAEEEATSLSAPEVPTTTTLEGGPAMHLNDASVEVERCALSFAPRILADAHELLLQPYYEKLLCRPSRPMAALRICGPATRVVLERDLQLEAWQVLHISQGADGACCYVLDLNHNQLLLRGPPSPQIILDDGCDLTIINGSVVLPCMVSLSSFVRFGPATALHVESTCRIVKLFAGRASLAESGVVGAGTTMELPSSGAVVIGRGSGGGTTRRGVAARPAVQVLFSMRSREVSVRLCLDGGSTNVPLSLHMSVAAQWAGELEDGRYTRSSGGVQVVGLRTGTCEEHVLLPTTLEANLSAEGGRLHVELAMDVVSLTVRMSHVGHLIRGVHDCLAALQIGNVDEDEEEVMANEASTPRAVVRWRDVAPVPVVLESEALVPLVLAATAGDCTRCGAIGLATLTEKPTRNNAADEEDEEEEESVGRWCSACCRGESNGFGQLLATADMHVDVREVDVLLLGSPALFAQVALRNARARREAAGDAHVEGQISAHVFSFSCAMWEPVVEHLDVVVDGSSANYRLSFPRCMFCCSPHGLATLSGLWEDACQAENRCTSASAVRGIVSAPRRAPLPYAEVLLRNATSSTLHVPCTNTTVPPGKSATTIIASESVMMLHLCHTGGAVEDEEEAIPCSLRAPPRYARGPGVVLAAHLSLHSPHTSSSTSSVAQRRVRLSIYPIHAATESLVRIINRLHCRVRFARGMADVEAGEWAYLPSTVNHRAALLVQPIPNNNKQDEEKEEDASAPSTVGLSLESLLRTRSCSTTSVAHDGGPTPVELHLTTLDAGLRAGVPCYDILVEAPLTLHNQLPYVVEISLSRGRDADRRMTEQLQRTQPIVVEPNVQASLPFFVGPHSLTSVCITMRVRLAVYGSGGASKNNHDDADVGVEMYESDAMSWSGTSSTTSWSHMCCLRSDGPSPQVMNLRLSRHDTCFSIMSPFIVRNATPLRLTIRECDANGDVVLAKERPCFAELPPDMKIGLPATSSAASQGSNTNELCVNVYHGSTSAKRIPLHALQHGLILLEEISSTPKTATNSNSSSSTEVRPTTFHLAYQSTLGSDGSMYVLITPRWMIVNRSLRPLYVIPTTPAAPRIIAAAREGLLPSCAAPAEGNDDGIANEPSTPLEATTPTTAAALASCALRVEAHTSAALLALPSIRGELCASIVLGLEDQRYGTPLSLEAIQSARVLLYAATQPSYEGGGGAYVECSLAARGACTYLTLEDAPHHPYDVINRSCFTLRVLDVSVQCPRRLMAEVAPGCRAPLMLDASITTVVEMELLEEVHPSAESVVAHHYFMDVARCTRAEKEGEPTKAVDCETNTTKAPVIEVKASYTAGGRHLVEVRGNTLEAPSSSSSLRPQLLHLNAAPATPFTLQVAVALLSLSVVMPGQELLHAVAMELRLSWQREATRERWSASITNFQVDNEVEEVPHYPAALFSIRRSSEESAVACCVVRDLLPGLHHPQMLCLDEVRVDVLPIALRVSDVLLVALARFVQSLEANHIRPHDDDDDDDGDDVDVRGEGVRRIGASSMEDDVPPPIPASPPLHLVLRRIIINPLQLRLWLSREPMDDEMRAFVEESLSSRHAALLARLMASCADIMITAPGLVRLRWDGRLSLFGAWLRASYVEVLLAQLHGVLLQYASSLPLIGAPLKLASALQSGAVRCFKDPVQGILTSPKAFAEGLASASVGMLHDMTAASLAAMANLSESGARLLSLGGGVSEQERRSLGTYAGLVRGLRGVVQRPMEGVAEGGAAGFVKGTAQGLLGAIASPAAGLLSDVARSTGTMAQLVDERYLPPTTRLREPRVFLAGGAVGPLGAVRSTRETQRIDLRTGRYAWTNLRGDGDPPAWDAGKPEEVMFHGVRLARSAWSMDRRHTTHDGWSYAATSAGPFRRTTAPETARLRRRRWATLVEPLPYSASAAAHHLVAGRALSRRPPSSHFVPSPMTTSVGTEEVMRNMDAGAEEPLVAYALPGVVEVSPREEGEGPRVPLTRGPAAPGAGMVSAAPPTHPPHHRHALLPPPPSRRSSATMSSAPPEPPSTSVVEVYELERRAPLLGWVKSWLPPDCPAWQDHRGCAIDGKEAVAPPVGWRWAGPWKVAATQSGSGWVELPTEPEGGRAKLRRRAWQRPVERITTSSNKTVVAGSDAVSSAH